MGPSQSIHMWSRCHHCGMNPVVGTLFRCETCPLGPEIDLCSACYEGYQAGRIPHPDPDSPEAGGPGAHHFARIENSPAEQGQAWLNVACPATPPPRVSDAFLVRPEFRFGRESVFGGYGFVVWYQAHPLLLTALHVMDELIKLKRIDATSGNPHYSGQELPAVVTSVRMYNVLKDQWPLFELGNAGPMLVLPDARTPYDEPFVFGDIAAFHLPFLGVLNVEQLAEREPEVGQPIWLAANMPDRSRTRRAVCVEKTSRSFVFRYDEAKKMPPHSSGAPLLDEDGAVVGINTGLGCLGGYEIGHANPVSSIRAHLAQALPPPPDYRGEATGRSQDMWD